MRLLYGHDADVAKFVTQLMPDYAERGFEAYKAIGVIDASGHLVGGMVWHNWWPEAGTIEFSGAALTPKWLTRRILNDLFAYAFDKANAQMIVTRNSGTNTRLHRQLQAYGFDRFDIPRLFGRADDGVIWTLTEEQFRMSRFNEQAKSADAA